MFLPFIQINMKKAFVIIALFVSCVSASGQYHSKEDLEYFIPAFAETRYDCHSALNEIILYNSEITKIQKGMIAVTLTFDSIQIPSDSVRILSVTPQWLRLQDMETDSILFNKNTEGIKDTILLRYQMELLNRIKTCKCVIETFDKSFIPLKVEYRFMFKVYPN